MVETKLVPTETIEQPMLSEAQLQELSGSARLYLRQRKIPIANNDIFTGAVAVLGDAVSRGLKEQGRAAVLESEHLTPLIKQGLKIREELCVQAGLDQKMAESLSMPDQLVSQAKQEIRNFALCPRPEVFTSSNNLGLNLSCLDIKSGILFPSGTSAMSKTLAA